MELNLVGTNLIVSNNNEELIFSYKYYLRGNPNLSNNIYVPINRYLKSLNEKDKSKIFNTYKKIYRILSKDSNDGSLDIKEVIELIQHYTEELYSHISFDNLRQWCLDQKDFFYHDSLKDDYSGYRPETTYLRKDYGGLLFLCTLLKLMCPIWSYFNTEFIKLIGKDYKETISVSFLNRTGILDIEEYLKLEKMVEYNSDKAVNTINAIFGNISTIDLPTWALASILVRKISIAEVNNPTVKIVNVIYSHLSNLNKRNSLEDRGDSVRLRERKTPDESTGDDEDRESVLEKYRLRQIHADHVLIIDEVYLHKFRQSILKIDPNFPLNDPMYKKYISNFKNINVRNLDINEFHLRITACIFERTVFPRNFENIQYAYFINMIFVTHLILHYWGFKTLSHLMIASMNETEEEVLKDTSYVTLSPNIRSELARIYPHFRYTTKTSAGNKNIELLNHGTIFINEIMDNYINRYNWFYNNEYLIDNGGVTGSLINIPSDIKNELAKLLIETVGKKVESVPILDSKLWT